MTGGLKGLRLLKITEKIVERFLPLFFLLVWKVIGEKAFFMLEMLGWSRNCCVWSKICEGLAKI